MTDAVRRLVSGLRRAESALSVPVDIAWLAALRVLFGLAMCVSMLRFIAYGWIDRLFIEPTFRFKYWGFEWVEALSPPLMHALVWALAALALAMAAGFRFRLAAWLFTLGFAYLELLDVTNYLNHYYLAALLAALLALSPAHRALSIDACLEPGRASQVAPRFWLYLFRFQVGVVYTFAGLAKAHSDWLLHAQPLRIWLGSVTDMPVLGALFAQPWAPIAMSWAGFLFDTTIVWWLLFRRTRPFAYALVIVFHTLTGLLFPIGMFPVIMVLAALVFFEPDWPRRLAAAVLPRLRGSVLAGSALATAPGRGIGRAALALTALYCAAQLIVPLRFLAYGGNVRWHEQGMRFSWRVMVREKNGSVTYLVKQKSTGRVLHVSPSRYLTPLQERDMSAQPDLILRLAHHGRDDIERRGFGPVEVRVEALVSLNGRKLAPLIDPDVDLTQIEDGIGLARWILPAPGGAPPHVRPI